MINAVIPPGYVLVPENVYQRFLKGLDWQYIEAPTMKDIHEYLGVGIDKIKKDIQKISCPLREIKTGGRGRGNEKKFFKETVDAYRIWIINN